jgi:hypothetical protein
VFGFADRQLSTPSQAYNKDFYQRALLRRDWYLRREEESLGEPYLLASVEQSRVEATAGGITWQDKIVLCLTALAGAAKAS